ncbi:MAG: hypothetical protein HS115_10835 [Spirochaetales bacterium]|nr:hypothetical protein [Spirochaetales bacterium]
MTLGQYLLDKGHGEREMKALLLSGRVLVNDAIETRAGRRLVEKDLIRIRPLRELRGSQKLLPVLRTLEIDLRGRIAVDVGAAHGGFTRVILECGAKKIYTVDVSYGQLEYSLRKRPEITVLERHNITSIHKEWFDPDDLAEDWFFVCDVSFLSLRSIVAALCGFRSQLPEPGAWEGLFLLKPQFEASHTTIKGVQPQDQSAEIQGEFQSFLKDKSIALKSVVPAAISGKKGNQEFFYYLSFA